MLKRAVRESQCAEIGRSTAEKTWIHKNGGGPVQDARAGSLLAAAATTGAVRFDLYRKILHLDRGEEDLVGLPLVCGIVESQRTLTTREQLLPNLLAPSTCIFEL